MSTTLSKGTLEMSKILHIIKILGLGLLGFSAVVGYAFLMAWNNWFIVPLALAVVIVIGFAIDTVLKVLRDE